MQFTADVTGGGTLETFTHGVDGYWRNAAGVAVGHWTPGGWHFGRVGDFDGDGRQEYAARRETRWWMLDFLSATSAVNVRCTTLSGPQSDWNYVAAAELTGDAFQDIVCRRNTSYEWWGLIDGLGRNKKLAGGMVGSDNELANLIRSYVPGVDSMAIGDKCRALCNWVSINSTATSQSARAVYANSNLYRPAFELFNGLLTGSYAGFCGWHAVFFQKIARLFGVELITVDFGSVAAGLTHVTTWLPQSGTFYNFDPTFNTSYRIGAGAYASIEQIWNGSAYLEQASNAGRRFVNDYTEFNAGYGFAEYAENWRDRYDAGGYDIDRAFYSLMNRGELYGIGTDPTHANAFRSKVADLKSG